MKKKLGILIPTLIGIILSISIISNIGLKTIFETFAMANLIWLIPYFGVSFLIVSALVLRLQLILEAHGHHVPFSKLFLIHTAGFAAGFLSPIPLNGGEGAKIFFLKKEGLSYQKAFSSIIVDKSINETMNVIFSFIGVVLILLYLAIPRNNILLMLVGLLVFAAILSAFYYRTITGKGALLPVFRAFKIFNQKFYKNHKEKIKDTERLLTKFFKNHRSTLKLTLVVSLISWIFMFAEYKLLLLTLGYNAPLIILFIVIAVVALAYMTPIPAALGTLEGGQISVFKFTNMKVSDGIASSIIIRTKDLIISMIGLLYMFNYGINFKETKFKSKNWDPKK